MSDQDKQQKIKVIGLYVIIILVAMRFLIYPLYGAIKNTENVLADEYENYRVKQQLLLKYKQTGVAKQPTGNSQPIATRLYEKGIPASAIQAEVLELLLKKAELYRLNVQSFETPEAGGGTSVGIIPVIIRVKGSEGSEEGFVNFLQAISKEKKALAVQSMEVGPWGGEKLYSLTIAAFRLGVLK